MENKWMGCVVVGTVAAIAIVLGSVVHGWALTILWGWFVVPVFGAPSLSIPYAIGLVLVVSMFRGTSKDDDGGDARERFFMACGKAFLLPLFALGLGWIVLQFV